jgi:hypothetical protein
MDAIGNTLQGTTAIRGSSQQAVNQQAQPEADPLAGSVNEPSRYYSPVVRIDSETQRTVLQFRDGSDGKVLVQYPSEKQLEAYRSKASTERAKEQEQAEARISGDTDAEGKTAGGQRVAGSAVAGLSSGGGESAGARAAASSAIQGAPSSISVSAPRSAASAPESPGPVLGGGGTGRPVLQSISA